VTRLKAVWQEEYNAQLPQCLLGLIRQDERLVFHFGDRLAGHRLDDRGGGVLVHLGSTGPSTACSLITISSAARAMSVPPDVA
jgi:hypothetical protein